MVANLKDNSQSWKLNEFGDYKRIDSNESEKFSAHNYFINNPSLSGRGSTLDEADLLVLKLKN